MNETERLQRASSAAIELPQTERAFAELRQKMIERWAATNVDHVATREKLFLAVQTLDAVRKALIQTAADGQVLQHAAEIAALLAPADQDRR